MTLNLRLLLKLKNSRRGLFHPDDIKTIGLASTGAGPLSAPLPSLSRKRSRHSISPRGTLSLASGSGAATPTSAPGSAPGHSRSGSFAGGSFGKAEFQKQRTEFGKYTEDDDEDYDDVFAKPGNTCKCLTRFLFLFFGLHECYFNTFYSSGESC